MAEFKRTKHNWSEVLEHALLGHVISCMVDAGYRVIVSDQDGGGLFVYGIADGGEKRPAGGYTYWVRCVPGNGADFISDYSTNLESVLAPANAFAFQFA